MTSSVDPSDLEVSRPLTLPCGLTLPNRLVKAAMAEKWADEDRLPNEKLIQTYGVWGNGGWGGLLTGNVQVDATYLGGPDDHSIDNRVPRDKILNSWKQWAKKTSSNGTPAIMQLNHPGRQSTAGSGNRSWFAKSIGPSPIPIQIGQGLLSKLISAFIFGTPREMTRDDIRHVANCFAEAAKLASEAGFSGVEIHAAHGYLLAQFLSSKSNQRKDEYGGSAKNRARIVVEVIKAIREVVPSSFCVGIKLNSVDHQSQKELEECIEQLEDIAAAGIDFLEISGGTYEDPSMFQDTDTNIQSTRTQAREAFFLDFARVIREKFRHVPLMVTGGFRTRVGMEAALREGACDIIGIGRPAVLEPALPRTIILNPKVQDADAKLQARSIAAPWLAKFLKSGAISGGTESLWYAEQIHHILSS
ncbi:NADH-dependent flavin oxidoreductase iccG [Cladobotryum mycophilum]|uniref:NADH-dependent flavin oxidoreductase iccG n=1 Tax=Cladobotryum mycophilum TaxID=491253 RepID=A0ABR0SW63_9HYPO